MKLYELHNVVSAAIGDAVISTENNIPDGPRFSLAMRNLMLYNGMLHILETTLRYLLPLSRAKAGEIIHREMPHSVCRIEGLTAQNVDTLVWDFYIDTSTYKKPLFIYQFDIWDGNTRDKIHIPIRNNLAEASSLFDSRRTQRAEPFAIVRNLYNAEINESTNLFGLRTYGLATLFSVNDLPDIRGDIVYLGYPNNPAHQEPNSDIDFEERYLPYLISYAVISASIMNDDITSLERYLPLYTGLHYANTKNQRE